MKEVEGLKLVREFHDQFERPRVTKPSKISHELGKLKLALLIEEVAEFSSSLVDSDLEEVLKELCDIQYVLSGIVLRFGFGDIFADAFREVHRSNMTKQKQSEENGQLKLKKTSNFSPANLKKFIK